MESSGVAIDIREARTPERLAPSDGRRRAVTPDFKDQLAVEQPKKSPSTQTEARALQLVEVEIIASRMKASLDGWKANDVDIALKAAERVSGVWPKAEFFAMLSTDLHFVAVAEFKKFEGVQDSS